jgi:hypothetical protein
LKGRGRFCLGREGLICLRCPGMAAFGVPQAEGQTDYLLLLRVLDEQAMMAEPKHQYG